MGQLIVRHLEDEIVQALEERAARHGRSVEAEHREILRQALLGAPAEDPKAVLFDMPDVGEDSDFEHLRDRPHRLGP